MIKLFISGFFLLLLTCNQTEKPTETSAKEKIETSESEESEFFSFYQSFVKAIESKNDETINTFFDEIFGVYFIEKNGVIPSFSKQYNVNSLNQNKEKYFLISTLN